jgi:RimJ/RimL family protein N-acetyltransferase
LTGGRSVRRSRPCRSCVPRGYGSDRGAPPATLNADPAVTEFLAGPLDRSASNALVHRVQTHWTEHGYGLWAVQPLDGPAFIGYVGLADVGFPAPFVPAVEIGWRLDRTAWGHGFATEAARAAPAFAFTELGLPEVVSFTATDNLRSRAVMERLGMTRDPGDDFDHPRLPADHPLRRHVLYRLSAGAEAPPAAGYRSDAAPVRPHSPRGAS